MSQMYNTEMGVDSTTASNNRDNQTMNPTTARGSEESRKSLEEKVEKKLVELSEFQEINKEIMAPKTLNYCINDYNINDLPE